MAETNINEVLQFFEEAGYTITKPTPDHWQLTFTDSSMPGRASVRRYTTRELIAFYDMTTEEYEGWMIREQQSPVEQAAGFLREMGFTVTQQDAEHWRMYYANPSVPGKTLDGIYTSAEVIEVCSAIQNAYKSYILHKQS